jgi:hypothetical protein
MSWTPISNTVPQYEENGVAASGFYIKFYQSGTTTPTAMAIDNTGATTLDKCELNTEGYPINGSGAVFIPHINQKYKILLYRNATDADNNTFSNKVWEVDLLFPVLAGETGTGFSQIPLNTDIVYPVANVTALRALTGFGIGQSFQLEGHTNAGLGGGELLCTKAHGSEVDNNSLLFVVNGFVIVRVLDGGVITPEMCGALGEDLSTDDTAAFNTLNAVIAGITDPVHIVMIQTYFANPLSSTNPIGGSYAAAFALTVSGSTVTGGGTVKIDNSVSYTAPFSAGAEHGWGIVQINANDCTVENIGFDGNGTGTTTGYDPAVVNIRWHHTQSFGSVGNHRKGNKVISNFGENFGGQSVSFQYQDSARILSNRFNGHQGMGVSVGVDPQVMFNVSHDCYDAPYPLNGNIVGGRIAFNYADGTNNGSGIDVVGCSGTEVCFNLIKNAQGAGIWIGYSVQQSQPSNNIHVHHNTLTTNAKFTGSPIAGEIVIGSTTNRADNATDVLVEDNTFIIDGSSSSNADRCLIIEYGTNDVTFRRNRIKGVANSNNNFAAILHDTNNLRIVDNESFLSATQKIGISSGTVNTLTVASNKGIEIDSSSTLFNNRGVLQDDGSTIFYVTKSIGTAAETVLTVNFTSTTSHAIIDVQATQAAEFRGVTTNRVTARSSSSTSPTILANTVVEALGNNPPLVTTTTSTGTLLVKLNSVGAAAITSISIRVAGLSISQVF